MSALIEPIVQRLGRAKQIVVMTGAGASAESGIPTFRDALEGHWSRFRPEELASPEAFLAHPERVSRWYEGRRQQVLACEPNDGHRALAQLEAWAEGSGRSVTLVTQNVDGLHQRAGSREVLELHGSILRWREVETGAFVTLPSEAQTTFPLRSSAGALLRPDVVWFGEALPETVLAAALAATASADFFVSVGTSGVVYPAAGLIDLAIQRGAVTVEINPQTTPFSGRVDYTLAGSSAPLLNQLVGAL